MATEHLPFKPGRLTDKVLQDFEFVRGKFAEAVSAVQQRDAEIQALKIELARQAGRVQDLSEQIRTLQETLPKVSVQALVGEFKAHVDRINADVRSQKTPGMLVDNVEVEVRGGIDVRDGLHITQLPVSALGAGSASVLKFNLKPSSPLKIVDDEPGLR